MIPAELIQWRLEKFWGYGNLSAPVWFVGMEEGLSNGGEEYLEARFGATYEKITADIRRDMGAVRDHMLWFRKRSGVYPYPIQSTIKYPIALYLRLKKKTEPSKFDISKFQGEEFGDGDTCALELMPLPSNKATEATWLYRNYGSLGLSSRSQYIERYKQKRVRELRELARQRRPELVIFYSVSYLDDWQTVAGLKLNPITRQMYFSRNDQTSFCVIPQGVAFGMSYEKLYQYADLIDPKVNFGMRNTNR